MFTYNKIWTKFETQALAYSLLRKNLYPQYLVRGDYKLDTLRADIAIFKANYGAEPTLRLILQVVASKSPHESTNKTATHENLTPHQGIPVIRICGGEPAYNILNIVSSYL